MSDTAVDEQARCTTQAILETSPILAAAAALIAEGVYGAAHRHSRHRVSLPKSRGPCQHPPFLLESRRSSESQEPKRRSVFPSLPPSLSLLSPPTPPPLLSLCDYGGPGRAQPGALGGREPRRHRQGGRGHVTGFGAGRPGDRAACGTAALGCARLFTPEGGGATRTFRRTASRFPAWWATSRAFSMGLPM